MILYADIPGERLDAFLARSVENLTRSGAQKLLEEGCVLRCGKPGKKNDKLNIGDTIDVTVPEPKEVDIRPTEMALDIVYEDGDLMILNKPAGLAVHPSPGHYDGQTLANRVVFYLAQTGQNPTFRAINRLDRGTSGLMKCDKNNF